MASGGSSLSILNLNVGGIVYTATLKTITRDPKSLLGRIFSGTHEVACDSKGNYFVDRDGSLFRHVLNFLRTGKLCLPQPFDEFTQLSAEADFYQVGNLIQALKARREGRGRNLPPIDCLSVIIIEECRDDISVSGRGELIKEEFKNGYTGAIGGYVSNENVNVQTKAHAFDIVLKHAFQLEDCNNGGSAATEYIFVGKINFNCKEKNTKTQVG